MDKLREGVIAAEAKWYRQEKNEIIMTAKQVGFINKMHLPFSYNPTENTQWLLYYL